MISPYWTARLTRDLTNLSLIRQPHCDGHIVSLHQSGTHWLRHMLSVLMANLYKLPEPVYLQDSDFILAPKGTAKHPSIPRFVSSHTIASPLLANRLVLPFLRLPKYVLLVRDPRAILVSHYLRGKLRNKISFAEYLRADIQALKQTGRRRFDKDIWWDIRFQNSWARMLALLPDEVHLVRYEDMRVDTVGQLHEVAHFLELPDANADILAHAVSQSSKEALSQKEAPDKKYAIVRPDDAANPLEMYSEDDKRFFLRAYRNYCKADFGYDLEAGW